MNYDKSLLKYYSSKQIMETSQNGYYREKINFIISQLQALKKVGNGAKILDIACNDGKLTEKYASYGEVTGIDINKEALAVCKKRGLKCLYGDLSSIKQSYKNYFDVVIAGDIIEHIFDTDEFLQDIRAVLKKNGKLLLSTTNIASFGRRLMLLFGKNPFVEYSTKLPSADLNCGHIRYWTVSNMLLQLQSNNFNKISISGDRINIFPPYLNIPYPIAKFMPTFARYMLCYAEK